jgi:phosphohistidine swiveling domain-containing protein
MSRRDRIWIVDDEPSVRFPIYTRGNAGEVFPNVVTPLTGSLFAEASVTAQTELFLELGFIVPRDLEAGAAPLTAVFGGYLYLNLSIGRLAGARSPGLTPDAIDTQLYGTYGAPPYVRRPGDRSLIATARILRGLVRTLRNPDVGYVDDVMRDAVGWIAALPDIAATSDRALLDLVPTFPARIERLFVALLRASTMSGTGRGIAEELLKRGGNGTQLVNRLTAGLGTIESALPARRLWDLGRLVAADDGLTAAFDAGVAGVGERIGRLRSDAANAFEHEFDSFLADHGHRGPDEYEFASPTWATRPEIAFAAVDRLRHAPLERSPHFAHERLAGAREAETAGALRSVARPLRPVLRRGLAAAIVGAAARERAKDAFVRELSGMRAVLDELVARAQTRGGPADRRDCYLVTTGELEEFVDDPSRFAGAIAERAARRDLLQARVPPFWFEGSIPHPDSWELRNDPLHGAPFTGALHGIGVCGGVASGPARVILDPADPRDIQPGDVLVAPITDPAWTPLFLGAAAVVVDVGAQQSHAAIVARELGIPAVVSVTGASQTIADGAWLDVDGDRGVVTVSPAR